MVTQMCSGFTKNTQANTTTKVENNLEIWKSCEMDGKKRSVYFLNSK